MSSSMSERKTTTKQPQKQQQGAGQQEQQKQQQKQQQEEQEGQEEQKNQKNQNEFEQKKTLLDVLLRDEHLIAISKPHGLLVHHSSIASDVTEVCVQTLRDQIGQKVYPVHRLDRQTGGVLLFALDSDMNSKMQQQFLRYECGKTYLALVRGFTDDQGTIDYPLKTDRGNLQDALSHYTTVQRFEVPIALGKFKTSRYSLVEVKPKTGRTHQIRRHFAHISHPIIGDRRHGCNRQNNLFRDHDSLQLDTMLLHASSLKFTHPVSQEDVTLEAELRTPFRAIVTALADMSLSNEEINMKIAHELELRRESTIALTNNKHNSNSTVKCEGNSNDNCGAESSEDCLLKRQKVHDTEYQSSHHT